jgi:membrane protein
LPGKDKRVDDSGPSGADFERTRQPGRGRQARTPTAIPARGWTDILWRVYAEVSQDRLISVAAGVTFYALLAVFPAVAAFVSVYGLFANPSTVGEHLASMNDLLPGGAIDIVGEQVKRIAGQDQGTLSVALVFSLAVSIWSANAGVKAMMDALNVVYDEEEKRSFVSLNLVSLTFTLGAIVMLLIAMSAIVVLPAVLAYVGLGAATEWLLRLGRWPVLLAIVVVGLAVLYRYSPSRTEAKWKWVTAGSLFAGLAWIVVSILFSWYVANFGSYNETRSAPSSAS